MRKLFTCLGIFALLTVFTAGPALAAGELPAALNGTSWTWNGFQWNGSNANANASVVVSYNDGLGVQSGYGRAQLNGTVFTIYEDAAAEAQRTFEFNNATALEQQLWLPGDSFYGDLPNVLSLSDWNSTGGATLLDADATVNGTADDIAFLPSSDYGLLVGISNSTFKADNDLFGTGFTTDQSTDVAWGANLALLTAGTTPAASELTGTWYFYQIGTNSSAGLSGITRSGSIDFDGDTATFDNLGTDVSATATADGIANDGAYVDITGYGRLFQNGTFDAAKKVMIGTYVNATTSSAFLTVLLKDGTVGSAADFQDASHKFVSAGSNSTGHASTLMAYYSTDSSQILTDGNATIVGEGAWETWPAATISFTTAQNKILYDTVTVGGVSQANATIQAVSGATDQAQILGRFNADKTFFVGFLTTDTGSTRGGLKHLVFVMPTQATVGSVAVESGTYNNATFANRMGVSATTTQAITSTVKATFGLDSDYSALTDMLAFNASINNTADDGATVTFRITIDDLAVSDVSTLRWLKMIEGTSANSTLAFTYKPTAATTPEDGHWWFENRDTNAYIASNGQLTTIGNYYLYYTIKDQTATASYDRDTAAGAIDDPAALFRFSGSSTSSSSNSGCVLNPAAGFGLEWLLLLAAPLLAVLRNRFRK